MSSRKYLIQSVENLSKEKTGLSKQGGINFPADCLQTSSVSTVLSLHLVCLWMRMQHWLSTSFQNVTASWTFLGHKPVSPHCRIELPASKSHEAIAYNKLFLNTNRHTLLVLLLWRTLIKTTSLKAKRKANV